MFASILRSGDGVAAAVDTVLAGRTFLYLDDFPSFAGRVSLVMDEPAPDAPAGVCFAGPPATGKWTMARAVSSALGGGSFAELLLPGAGVDWLRGSDDRHGVVIQALRRTSLANPVFILLGLDSAAPSPQLGRGA